MQLLLLFSFDERVEGQERYMQTITDDITAVNETIAEKIGQQKFRIWFKNSTRMSLADGYLKVGVPNLFIGSWIENHFANEINEAVRLITGQGVKVIFNIDPELSGSQR
ncbi:MAG TPA: DnaA N-terminal domain-containing protein, partial [Methylococcales bacterium]